MTNTQHWNIYVPNGAGKQRLIDQLLSQREILPAIIGKRILLYSAVVLAKYIREEDIHDKYEVTNQRGQTLKSMSSGERKKALLQHILSQQPEVIILDNPSDSLDVKGREDLVAALEAIAGKVSTVNIVSRTRDFLAIGTTQLQYAGKELVVLQKEIEEEIVLKGKIPEPIQPILYEDEYLIRMKNVSVSYLDRCILKAINWEIKPGEFWQLKGPNGAGKTTLLTMITGDNHKAYGQDITLFGFKKGSGESVWDIKKNIGYYTSTMTYDFWRNQSIEHMIISGYYDSIGLYNRPTELQLKRTEAWLDLIGLKEQRDKPFIDLPIGYRRLVLIVRAMVKHPPLLILDEPASDLDDHNTKLMAALVNKIAQESKTAILYVSHQDEKGLHPDRVFELIASEEGSVGIVLGV
ncbi:ATP-binding cassette domain-containing protein [Reichenbachiella agarivorans]|uniref:ATP-binding cassette domain-containing protein n=1 Tax=Reichenbachiella agarivorans TaxID=2979464 RepID=A0ABY6CR42_9BACT|nr:ATP-binding cassette domain-containing protein [Reichenbachiella agarivorans]UXP31843.1 ATP-binding cassette domain-containing protein [Reichenbachiella agarivorans]